MADNRYLTAISPGMPATDGAGVQLTRMVGTPQLDMVDPFLMLDRIDSDDPDELNKAFLKGKQKARDEYMGILLILHSDKARYLAEYQ